ncbi:putative secreted protein (Por secretion system target) [Oceanihabitans sediminis]|uniref:T9SS C-terminal target domain-containing protein n=1 Tax=Oceanihabitans sediminis TaxID=1812012 RepID=A0A368P544_9FLAO|nr:endonuclease [Oceanihabitans sediminis]RBP30954.1 putative secreted protein (Por secretion system target) [Oceanihabitans sediminis]RCU56909.1 T9SS C-terminal target domain-containing protein [Oceanihabitans sediminis]
MKTRLLLALLFPFLVFSQTPQYYANIDFSQSGENLKAQLTTLITNTHTNPLPYTASATDTWDVIRQSDLVQQQSNNVLLVYGYNDNDTQTFNDRTRSKNLTCHTSTCNGLWNREHVFPRSLANPNLDVSYPGAGTDVHNLRSADSQFNSSRSNRIFQDGSGNATITSIGNFYPGDEHKGDIARIIMYMYTRYPNQCEAINTGYGTANNAPLADMPDLFLKWNAEDPVSQFEIDRNEIIYQNQGNRNPYIDNPYLATLIWNGQEAQDTWGTLSITNYQENQLAIYPTHTTDYIYITGNTKNINYTIHNLLGQEIIKATTKNQIEVATLQNGIYILNLWYNNTKQTKKIIKI